MANHDFLTAYTSDIEGWLRSEGCAVPSAAQGNYLPTIGEIAAAVEA